MSGFAIQQSPTNTKSVFNPNVSVSSFSGGALVNDTVVTVNSSTAIVGERGLNPTVTADVYPTGIRGNQTPSIGVVQ